jgi:putative ABC transport system permease protein
MLRHLLRLVWNRKRATAMIMLEVAIAFLVVFAVAAVAVLYAYNWRQPLGFEWRDVWAVEVDTNVTTDDTFTPEQVTGFRQLLREAAAVPGVVAAAGAFIVPYELSATNGSVTHGDRRTWTYFDEVTDGFAEVVGLRVVAGRWFGPEDDAAAIEPIVLNRRLARELFEDADPIGKVIERSGELRVVGVVDDFRQHGELATPGSFAFTRVRVTGAADQRPPRKLLLKMARGTTAAHEQMVLARLAPVAPQWSLEVQPLAQERDGRLRLGMAPLVVGAIVGTSLLLMVALGLLGVLWQNVTRRTRELGLRRAVGASRQAVHRQVLAELALLTTLALVAPVALVLQLPLLGVPLAPVVFWGALAAALLTIYGLALLCGLYPSRFATRLAPADALHWE